MHQRIDSLTGLRAFAAVWVMLMHFREITPEYKWQYPLADSLIKHGGFGVDLFFVLSGFILTQVYYQQFSRGISLSTFWKFAMFRIARIYPVHVVTLAVMIVLYWVSHLWADGGAADGSRFGLDVILYSLLLVHDWVPEVITPNMPAWSISAEWFAYLLFPGLCLVTGRIRSPIVVLAGAGIVLGYGLYSVADGHHLVRVMAGFLIGMAANRIGGMDKVRSFPSAGLIVLCVILLWIFSSHVIRLELLLVLFAALIISVSKPSDYLGKFMSLRFFVYLGEISYALYMVHWIVRIVVRTCLEKAGLIFALPPTAVVGIYCAGSFVAAALLYHFVEEPGRRRLRRLATPRSISVA